MSAVGKLNAICAVHEAFDNLIAILKCKSGKEGDEFDRWFSLVVKSTVMKTGRKDLDERIRYLLQHPLTPYAETEMKVIILEIFLDGVVTTPEEDEQWKKTLANVRATLDAWKEAEKSADTTIN